MVKLRAGLALLCVVAVLVSGCNVQNKVSEVKEAATRVVGQVQQVATAVATEAATEAAAPTATPEPTEEPQAQEAVPTEAPDDVPELKSAEELPSHRQTIVSTTEVGGEVESRWSMLTEYDVDTPATRFLMTVTDEGGETLTTETIQVGDTTYTRFDDQWMSFQSSEDDLDSEMAPWASAEHWVNDDCSRVGRETVAGENTIHYTCDIDNQLMAAQALGSEEIARVEQVDADFWLSEEYDVAIKSEIVWQGVDSDGNKVVLRYESLIEDIGGNISITKPEGAEAPGAGSDMPIYEGAQDTMSMAGMVMYEVEASEEAVSQFYQDELTAAGWTYLADESMAPMMMSFSKGDETLTVMIGQEGTTTSVTLMRE